MVSVRLASGRCNLYLVGVAETVEVKRRRRGDVLERALLQAIADELDAVGYEALTYDAVATRAQTSRTSLYRRWPAKADLVRAVLEARSAELSDTVNDTGNLRGDVVALLRRVNTARGATIAATLADLDGLYRDTGATPAGLREGFRATGTSAMEIIQQRAIARGELRANQLSARMLRMPVDLLRNELLSTLAQVSEDVIDEIVDDLFLPVVASTAR